MEINVARFVRANSFRRSACVPVQQQQQQQQQRQTTPPQPKQQPQDNIQHETIGRCKGRTITWCSFGKVDVLNFLARSRWFCILLFN